MMMLLAQSAKEAAQGIYLWLGVIVLAAVVLGVVAAVVRKRVSSKDDGAGPLGFTLADLRELHAKGEMSDEQFEQAKGQMLAQGRSLLAADPGDEADSGGISGNPVEEIHLD